MTTMTNNDEKVEVIIAQLTGKKVKVSEKYRKNSGKKRFKATKADRQHVKAHAKLIKVSLQLGSPCASQAWFNR